ncbi:hypothetical protein [Pseudonocardia sp. ICBG601]|uniref:hypothetical protein n=1 Tax=Pseudonocardia sp. ICBG601 TaxID=2846759 RepID=UPI001CF61459|nr:hypothetical protein [Pseudonocardia sp. ICBG601]
MNALFRRVVAAVRDRLVEIAVVAALTVAAVWLTWWFAAPLGFVTGWWAAAELRLWQARRAVPASTTLAGQDPGDVSGGAVSPSGRVSAGQRVEGRAGA